MNSYNETNIKLQGLSTDSIDLTTFFSTILLLAIGLISIYSSTYEAGMSTFFYKQLKFAGIGVGIMLVAMYLPERWLQSNTIIVYGFVAFLLVAVLIFGRGIAGTKGWFEFGGFSLQPSELGKPAAILLVAKFLSYRGTDIRTFRDFSIVIGIIMLPVLLIVIEPDIGSASVFGAILLGVLLWTGFDIFILFMVMALPIVFILSLMGFVYFVVSVIILSVISFFFKRGLILRLVFVVAIVAVGYFSTFVIDHIMPHQKARIETFLNPGSDPKGKGYNVIQSTLAVGSGGLAGKGFLQGTQTQLRYIPEQRTDFIYCVPTEEFGFLGGALVIVLYSVLIWRTLKIATETNSKFFSIIAFSTGTMFLYHCVINIGMVIGIMPVMGIPLPMLSYGGSSLIANLGLIGLLLNAYRSRRENRGY
jgi:rod shape determining protein RodA